jgi:hypothetical protein
MEYKELDCVSCGYSWVGKPKKLRYSKCRKSKINIKETEKSVFIEEKPKKEI